MSTFSWIKCIVVSGIQCNYRTVRRGRFGQIWKERKLNAEYLFLFCIVANISVFLPPANEVWGKVIFLHQFVILLTGGGHAWLLPGGCMVAPWGARVVLFGGVCMVLFGGHAWFYSGGAVCGFIQGDMHGFIWGACMVLFRGGMCGFFSFFGYNEIRSMSRRYASYWNAFLFSLWTCFFVTMGSVVQYILVPVTSKRLNANNADRTTAKFSHSEQAQIQINRRFHVSREQSRFGVNEAPKTIVVSGNHMEFWCYFSIYC